MLKHEETELHQQAPTAESSFTLQGQSFLVVPAGKQWKTIRYPHQLVGELAFEDRRYVVLQERVCGEKLTGTGCGVVDTLTPRELQVALLVSKGRLNKQIANQLQLSEWTVSSHLRRIYAKLGVHSRAAMVAAILREAV